MSEPGPLKWEGRLEEAFMTAVKSLGGIQQARPKQVLLALQPQFEHLDLRVDQMKWHLQAHRRREEREAEWLASQGEGPVRWTGMLKEAFDRVVAELGGLSQARPKAVWEALSPTYPMLTVASCKWHIQTLRKRKARGGGGEGADEDDSDAKPADGSRSSAPAAGLESPARPQQPEETRSLASAAQQAAHTRRLVVRQQRGRAQQEGSLANWQEDGQVPGGGPGSSLGFLPSIVSGASGPTNGSPGFKPAQEAEQARWQEPAAQQRQQQQDRPRGMLWDLGVAPWEPHLPAAVEARVRSTRTAVQRVRQIISELEHRAACQAELVTVLEGHVSSDPVYLAQQLAAMASLPPHTGSLHQALSGPSSLRPAQPGASSTEAAGTARIPLGLSPVGLLGPPQPQQQGAGVLLRALLPELEQQQDARQQAALAAAGGHDPACCTVPGCRHCAYARRLAQFEAAEQAAAAAGQRPAAQVRQQQPPHPPPPLQQSQQQEQLQQLAAAAGLGRGDDDLSSLGTLLGAAENLYAERPQQPQAPSLAAQELCVAHPELHIQVCTAICHTVPAANAAGRAGMATWLLEAGAHTPEDVVLLLDGNPQFVGVAVEATKGSGVKLLQWAALNTRCKEIVGAVR